ncbi:MAG TPA: hypothetical protein VLG71_00995 [Candidatus Limnocylindria bacterium]|nr:hypothetical protein [Candidatus Limnocylindria bacterium]
MKIRIILQGLTIIATANGSMGLYASSRDVRKAYQQMTQEDQKNNRIDALRTAEQDRQQKAEMVSEGRVLLVEFPRETETQPLAEAKKPASTGYLQRLYRGIGSVLSWRPSWKWLNGDGMHEQPTPAVVATNVALPSSEVPASPWLESDAAFVEKELQEQKVSQADMNAATVAPVKDTPCVYSWVTQKALAAHDRVGHWIVNGKLYTGLALAALGYAGYRAWQWKKGTQVVVPVKSKKKKVKKAVKKKKVKKSHVVQG